MATQITNILNFILGLLNLIFNLLFFVPPIVDVVIVIIAIVLLFLIVKRFKLNSIVVQIIGVISLFLYPLSLLAIALIPLVAQVCILLLGMFGYALYPLFTVPLESIPIAAIVIFFSIWFIFFIMKVKILFEKKFVLAILIAVQVIFAILALGFFLLLRGVPTILSNTISIFSNMFPRGIYNLVMIGKELIVMIVYFLSFLIGSGIFFLPFTGISVVAWKSKKLDTLGLILLIQAFFICALLFTLTFGLGRLLGVVDSVAQFVILRIIGHSTSFWYDILSILETFLFGVEWMLWTVTQLVCLIETIVVVFVYAAKLGTTEQQQFGGEEATTTPNEPQVAQQNQGNVQGSDYTSV